MPFVDETRVTIVDSSQLQPSDSDAKMAAFTGDNLVAQPKKVEVIQNIAAVQANNMVMYVCLVFRHNHLLSTMPVLLNELM